MKIEFSDILIIYFCNEYLKHKNYSIAKIEDSFKDIFKNLKYNYGIEINGYYDIDVYIDKSYGIVIEMKKEEFDLDYYDQVDMTITFHNEKFLYEVDDISVNKKIYKYKNKYYVDKYIPEHSKIIYKTDRMLKCAKIIEIKT